jgi:hypothetical protein
MCLGRRPGDLGSFVIRANTDLLISLLILRNLVVWILILGFVHILALMCVLIRGLLMRLVMINFIKMFLIILMRPSLTRG